MKRKFVIPSKPSVEHAGDKRPRERRTLGIRFDQVTGDAVSGLR